MRTIEFGIDSERDIWNWICDLAKPGWATFMSSSSMYSVFKAIGSSVSDESGIGQLKWESSRRIICGTIPETELWNSAKCKGVSIPVLSITVHPKADGLRRGAIAKVTWFFCAHSAKPRRGAKRQTFLSFSRFLLRKVVVVFTTSRELFKM